MGIPSLVAQCLPITGEKTMKTAILDSSRLDGQKQFGLTNREWLGHCYFKV
jgi:hypothetical protein